MQSSLNEVLNASGREFVGPLKSVKCGGMAKIKLFYHINILCFLDGLKNSLI